jgi:hypothetical protein
MGRATRFRLSRLVAVGTLALTVAVVGGGSPAAAATFRDVNCTIAWSAFNYALDQHLSAPPGSSEANYWQTKMAYWAGYIEGAGC